MLDTIGRVQRVVIEGVPQGKILGPVLFLIFISDIPSHVNCKIDLFAHDSVLHKQIKSTNNCEHFQGELESVSNWCDASMIQVKEEKCRILDVTKKKNPAN